MDKEDIYAYKMVKEIENHSSGVFTFKEGTLYPILHTLDGNGMVESYWQGQEDTRKREYYRITKLGTGHLKEQETSRLAMEQVLGEGRA